MLMFTHSFQRRRVPVKPYRMGRDGSAQSFREHDEQDDLLDVLATVEVGRGYHSVLVLIISVRQLVHC